MGGTGNVVITPGYLIADGEQANNAKFRLMASPVGQVGPGAIGSTQLIAAEVQSIMSVLANTGTNPVFMQSIDFTTAKFNDGVLTVGSTTFTSATANFMSTDVGDTIVANGVQVGSIIQSVLDTHTVILTRPALINYNDGVISGTTLTSLTAAFTAADNGRTIVSKAFIAAGTTITFFDAQTATLSLPGTTGVNVPFSISGRTQSNVSFIIIGRGTGWRLQVDGNGVGNIEDYVGYFGGIVAINDTVIESDGSITVGQGLNTMFVDSFGNATWGSGSTVAGFTNQGKFFAGSAGYQTAPVTIAENGNVTVQDISTNVHNIATGAVNPFVAPVIISPPGGATPTGGLAVALSCATRYSRIYYRLATLDGVSTNGSTTYSSAGGSFSIFDVGKIISGTNIPASTFITAVSPPTQITLSAPATASGTGLSYFVVPDNTDALYNPATQIFMNFGRVLTTRAYKNGEYSAFASATFTVDATTVSTPLLSPPPGSYGGASLSVLISDNIAGSLIRYTIGDGTQAAPTSTTGTGPFGDGVAAPTVSVALTATTNIQAIAYKTGLTTSGVAGGTFTIGSGSATKTATPTFSPDGFSAPGHGAATIIISTTTAGAQLRYTLDSSVPTPTHGTLIASPSGTAVVPANSATILQAIAFASGFLNSDVKQGSYNFTTGGGGTGDPGGPDGHGSKH